MINQLNKLIAAYRELQPLSEDCQKKLDKKFRLEFNYNSNHLEGNTLTYGETKLLLLFDQTKGNHELRELEEMKGHDVALIKIKEEAADTERPLTEQFIKELNEIILVRPFWKEAITADGQSTRRQIKVGEYKAYPNSVVQSNGEIFEYASPQDTPIQMAELVQWYNTEAVKGESSAIELAALLHYRYIRIHPFDDGNGRVARLLVNYVLYRNDLPPVIIKTDDKKNYLRVLQQADAGDLQAFVDYMISQLAWSIDLSIKAAKGENIEEQDDWEKQLTLLKKGLGDKSGNVIKKSEESVKAVIENVLTPFVDMYEEKLSQFDNLFMDRFAGFYVENIKSDPKNYSKLNLKDSLQEYLRQNEFNPTIKIGVGFYFKGLRKPHLIQNFQTIETLFHFQLNAYAIELKKDYYRVEYFTKLYNEFLSEDEMRNIISDIAKDLLDRIEGLKIP